jgi:DNA polymerase III alpha subunit
MNAADIDIDTPTTFNPKDYFPWTKASILRSNDLFPHPCGFYPENIPEDNVTGLAAIPYEDAENLGYSKIDFLHLSIYDHFKTRDEIDTLLTIEPDWGLLVIPSEQKKLFQLANHGDVLSAVKPKDIMTLADVLALIRPGKKKLLKLYLAQKETTRKILYQKDETGYSFKKSHAISYAHVIWLQLHLIEMGLI